MKDYCVHKKQQASKQQCRALVKKAESLLAVRLMQALDFIAVFTTARENASGLNRGSHPVPGG